MPAKPVCLGEVRCKCPKNFRFFGERDYCNAKLRGVKSVGIEMHKGL